MSFFSNLLGGFGSDALSSVGMSGASSALSNYMNSALQVENQKEMLNYTDQLQRKWVQDQYALQREGLEKAGYNPLLAFNSAASAESLQAGSGFSGENSAQAAAAGRQAKAQEQLVKSSLDLNRAKILQMAVENQNNSAKTVAEVNEIIQRTKNLRWTKQGIAGRVEKQLPGWKNKLERVYDRLEAKSFSDKFKDVFF